MAEIIASAVINVLFEKLISGDLMNLARSEGIDPQMKILKKALPLIQAVLADAGQKQIRDRFVELWLRELHDLAYDIDDVLDNLATEAMRRKLNQESHASTSTGGKVMKMIPTYRNIKYGREMSSKLDEITAKLQYLVEQKKDLGLDVNVERSYRKKRRIEQTSLVDESKVMGREGDKEVLIGKLLGYEACNENVSIVSLVGMGGIGKTTLAKVLYNEEKVKDHFELRAWVCVCEEFDVFNISKAIYQAVVGEDKNFVNLDLLHVALKEKLSKKRFLFVLDDVWNEDYKEWKLLQSPFVVGAPGSKIIVTTRKTTVASVVDSDEAYTLDVLSNEEALSLFALHSLNEKNFDKHPKLKMHAEGIVKKCGRLPLALETLGRVLKTKKNENEWEELLNSQIWNLHDEREILPALKLSYYDLPPHLKQLFAYCSLFPKDYGFDKNELVVLWIAEGFLSNSNGRNSMESLGGEYFEELKSRLFFQHSIYYNSRYTMHDLINDLARSVAGEFFFMLDDKMDDAYDRNEAFEKFRHFSFIGRRDGVYRKLFKELQRARCLRTFLPISFEAWRWEPYISLSNKDLIELLPRLQFLRVLSLAHCSITEIPQSIGDLKHMRYLNFSCTAITCLPEQVSNLYNLQSLLVSGCPHLCSLPVSFVKLKNLRHLDITYTPELKKMPLGIGGSLSLQTLTRAIIEGPNGFKISELTDLSNLQGRISIEGLHNVINAEQAKNANLQQKKRLDELVLQWREVFDDSQNEMVEYEVLKELRPHHTLRKLDISFYGGTRFPSWVGSSSFGHLTELRLRGCRNCTHLPKLGYLRSLQKLYVSSMDKVLEFCAPANSFHDIAFPSLEVLEFYYMERWEKWSTSGGDKDATAKSFPRLRRISIQRCPKLAEVSIAFPSLEEMELIDIEGLEIWSTGGDDKNGTARSFTHLRRIYIHRCPKLAKVLIGSMPSLQVLNIEGCSEVLLRSLISVSSSILTLSVYNVKGLIQLDGVILKHLKALKDVRIAGCDELRYLWESELEACKFLVSLRKLDVSRCRNLVSLGEKELKKGVSMQAVKGVSFRECDKLEGYNCPSSVESLEIYKCCSMTTLSFSPVQELPSSLKFLSILQCSKLRSFHGGCLVHLTDLTIFGCDNIKCIPENVFGLRSTLCLRNLEISNCKNMKSIPHEHLQSLKTLEKLSIEKCPSMDYSTSGVFTSTEEKDARNCSNDNTTQSCLLPSSSPTSKVNMTPSFLFPLSGFYCN